MNGDETEVTDQVEEAEALTAACNCSPSPQDIAERAMYRRMEALRLSAETNRAYSGDAEKVLADAKKFADFIEGA